MARKKSRRFWVALGLMDQIPLRLSKAAMKEDLKGAEEAKTEKRTEIDDTGGAEAEIAAGRGGIGEGTMMIGNISIGIGHGTTTRADTIVNYREVMKGGERIAIGPIADMSEVVLLGPERVILGIGIMKARDGDEVIKAVISIVIATQE